MLHAHQARDVVKVVQNIFDGHRLRGARQHAHRGNAHHAAGCSQAADGFVTLVASMRGDRFAICVSKQNRPH